MREPHDLIKILCAALHKELKSKKHAAVSGFFYSYASGSDKMTVALATEKGWNNFRSRRAADISEKGIRNELDSIFERIITRTLRPGEYPTVCEYMSTPVEVYAKYVSELSSRDVSVISKDLMKEPRLFLLRISDWIEFDVK